MFKYGELLKMCRMSAHLTQKDLAIRAFTNQATISQYERGKRIPNVEVFEKLIDVCGYEIGVREKLK